MKRYYDLVPQNLHFSFILELNRNSSSNQKIVKCLKIWKNEEKIKFRENESSKKI